MYDNNKLQNIKNYFGTSIGTVISYLLILGYNPTEILLNVISEKLIDNYKKINVVDIANGNGGFSWRSIDDFLTNCTLEKCEQPMSFEDIWKRYNVYFECCAYNINEKKIEYFSYKTHPKLLCTSAIRMSCNIPLIFPRYRYLDNYYIDGGIVDNFPILRARPDGIVFGIYLEISTDLLKKKLNNHDISDANKDDNVNTENQSENKKSDPENPTETKEECTQPVAPVDSVDPIDPVDPVDSVESVESVDPDIDQEMDQEIEGCDEIVGSNSDFTLQDYVFTIFTTPLTYHNKININKFLESIKDTEIREKTQILVIPTIKTALNFNLTTYDQLEMFSHGYQYVKLNYE